MNGTLIIYDADSDGFGCAYAAWKRIGDKADYLEVGHGTKYIPSAARAGYEIVYICDLSFSKEEVKRLREHTGEVIVIDHHESSREWLEELGYTVDTDRAACVQVWEHFHKKEAPLILQYVADRDVWAWKLYGSEHVNNVIFLTDKTFEAWDDLSNRLGEFAGYDVRHEGELISKYREKLVDWIVEYHDVIECYIDAENSKLGMVPVVCSPILHSEVGHRLLNMYPDAPFVMTYVDEPSGYTKWSMRSEDHRTDVGAIAKARGGGGHRNAAGYRT